MLRPGNAGGAEDPDLWCAFEDGEVKVIGDEPENTEYDPDLSEEAHIAGRRFVTSRGVVARRQHQAADHRVPCGEASRKAVCGKSARTV